MCRWRVRLQFFCSILTWAVDQHCSVVHAKYFLESSWGFHQEEIFNYLQQQVMNICQKMNSTNTFQPWPKTALTICAKWFWELRIQLMKTKLKILKLRNKVCAKKCGQHWYLNSAKTFQPWPKTALTIRAKWSRKPNLATLGGRRSPTLFCACAFLAAWYFRTCFLYFLSRFYS